MYLVTSYQVPGIIPCVIYRTSTVKYTAYSTWYCCKTRRAKQNPCSLCVHTGCSLSI